MAEVQERPSAPRGRGSGRAGRGGYSSRGGRTGAPRTSNGDVTDLPVALPMVSLDEQGEMGQLKKAYASQLGPLKEMFPDWTDDDFVLALQETDGDLPRTIERISEGNVSQFSDVKKKSKEKSRVRKESSAIPEVVTTTSRSRGRGGHDSTRGSRGRGSERGGRSRGRAGREGTSASADIARSAGVGATHSNTETSSWGDETLSAPTGSNSWEDSAAVQSSATTIDGQWPGTIAAETNTVGQGAKSSLIPQGSKKSWASMLAQPKSIQVAPKKSAEHIPSSEDAVESDLAVEPAFTTSDFTLESVGSSAVPVAKGLTEINGTDFTASAEQTPPPSSSATDIAANLTPPRDQLTEDNLENLPDSSIPPATETELSTRDPGSTIGTPYGSSHQVPTHARPPMGGYATTAWKATGVPGRSASFQRRIMEQSEPVVMPVNQGAVDRAAVQFGSMGMNGDSNPLDVDDDREEAQTRAPVAQSPPSQPRTSLPPAPLQPSIAPEVVPENVSTPKQAPGLPLTTHTPSTSIAGPSSHNPLAAHTNQQQGQPGQTYGGYGRYGAAPHGQDSTTPVQKPYDPFNQQMSYPQSQAENQSMYQTHSQPQQAQGQVGNYSQGPNEYSSQYGGDHQRNNYQNYYGSGYGQQTASTQQEQNPVPQRSGSTFAAHETGYGSVPGTGAPGRFTERDNSGHNTPNPTMASQQQIGGQSQQLQQTHPQAQNQTSHGGAYGYQNPYYGGSYYGNSFMNQYPNNYYNQQAYGPSYGGGGGGAAGGKGNMYGQPNHGYGMSPQASYEQSASPANSGAFSANMQARGSGLSEGFSDYARSGSTQPTQQSTSGAGGYPSHLAESYNRGAGGYSAHNQPYGQQQADDSLKPYGETKAGGPSPAMGQPGRTSSATGYGGNQPQSYGGYPNHLNQLHSNHGSAYGGIGGLGSQYGQSNYNNYGRGGWSGNYGH